MPYAFSRQGTVNFLEIKESASSQILRQITKKDCETLGELVGLHECHTCTVGTP